VAPLPAENEAEQVAQLDEVKEVKPVEQQPEIVKEQLPDTQIMTAEALPDPPKEEPKKEEPRVASVPSNAASGIGRGSSTADANYPGLVAAHLARHKQYPTAARNNRIQGVGEVTFSVDGNGRVTSVSIARATGNAALDQELVAMVHRSAPFPKPPGAQSRSFTVPVTFRLEMKDAGTAQGRR
jgi:protein TonB